MTELLLPKEHREFLRQQYGHDRKAFPDLFEALDDLDMLDAELANWQRFASYCRSCALSGESDPQDFGEFCRIEEKRIRS